jgi:hypothetical protein
MLNVEVKTFFTHLESGNVTQARELLPNLPIEGIHGSRIRKHYEAQLLMQEGQLADAANLLRDTLQSDGEYVGLLVDLANCYARLGSINLWKHCVRSIEKALTDARENMETTRWVHYQVWLAKHFEEEGEVVKALKIYDLICESFPHLPPSEYLMVQAQRLRLTAEFIVKGKVAVYYRELVGAPITNLSESQQCEFLHSLMLAELGLFGVEHGFVRLQEILKAPAFSDHDKRFALVDFIHASGVTQALWPKEKFGWWSTHHGDAFENLILEFYQTGLLNVAALNQETHRLTWASQMRVLLLVEVSAKNETTLHTKEISSRLTLCLEVISPECQSLWWNWIARRRAQLETQTDLNSERTIQFEVCNMDQAIYIGKSEGSAKERDQLAIGPFESVVQMFNLLNQRNRWPTLEVCSHLWPSTSSIGQFDRCRMMIRRINQRLLELGYGKLIKVTKTQVSLSRNVKIQVHNLAPER